MDVALYGNVVSDNRTARGHRCLHAADDMKLSCDSKVGRYGGRERLNHRKVIE